MYCHIMVVAIQYEVFIHIYLWLGQEHCHIVKYITVFYFCVHVFNAIYWVEPLVELKMILFTILCDIPKINIQSSMTDHNVVES